MKYKIKRYDYLHYELEELEEILNKEAAYGYRLIRVFSGCFIFKKSEEIPRYSVLFKDQSKSKAGEVYLDKYLQIRTNISLLEVDINPRNKLRKKVLSYCLLSAFVGIFALLLELLALNVSMFDIRKSQYQVFALSILYYINYMVFACSEIGDYLRNIKGDGPYKRPQLKRFMFSLGRWMEIILLMITIFVCLHFLILGQVLFVIGFLIICLIETWGKYYSVRGFFSYLYSFEIYMVLCFAIQNTAFCLLKHGVLQRKTLCFAR